MTGNKPTSEKVSAAAQNFWITLVKLFRLMKLHKIIQKPPAISHKFCAITVHLIF